MSQRIKRILRSVSSASSRASSDRSYADTYFDEIGFKMGDNSCLGSTESPDQLDGEQILFHQQDKLFYESEEEEDDHDHVDKDDHESADTAPSSNHHPFLSPPVGLSKDDVNGKREPVRPDIMALPLDYVVQENRKSKRRLNDSFEKGDPAGIIYHHDQDTSLEYSPSRPHPITTLGAHDASNHKLDTGRSAKTWFFNLDSVVIGETDFLHKSTSHSVEEYKERAFRVKATIWFLFFLGTFLLISAIVILMLAFEQGRQAEFDRARNNQKKDVDLIDHDDNFLTPLAEGWEVEEDFQIFWNRTTDTPTTNLSKAPSLSPTTAAPTITLPTQSPTALFTSAQEELVNTLTSVSMDSNLKQRITRGSPQFRAVQWLADDPFLAAYSDNRILQRWAVATFYFSTNGDSWQTDDNENQAIARQREQQYNQNPWMIPTTNECWWFTSHDEAICDGKGQLETLSLNGIGLKGRLPRELGFLTMLKHISLFNNHIGGSMPSELGNLKHLETLQVSFNKLTGAIPHTFGRLKVLESLELQHNQISHGLPTELGNLEVLKKFKANNNKLEGSLPVEFFSLFDLETLNLESNDISGEIPLSVAALPKLQELTIQNNDIVGTMPFESCHLSTMIADCDEVICECCNLCCIGCQGTIGQLVDTTGTQAPTVVATGTPTIKPTPGPTKAPTKAPTRIPNEAPTRKPSTAQPTTTKPTSRPTRTPTEAPTRTATPPPTSAPTRKPTTNKPTRPPTKRPTTKPTAAPTKTAPTNSPTAKPIEPPPDGIHILVSVGNDGIPERLYPLKMCQGDCDGDRECAGDLVCFGRNKMERVPGCLGQGVANRDYCTHPHFVAEADAGDYANGGTDNGAKPGI